MKPALLFVALFATVLAARAEIHATAVLADDTYAIPAGEWRWKQFQVGTQPATVDLQFQSTGGEARAELVNKPDIQLFHDHKPHDALAYTETTSSGGFNRYVRDAGQYAVIIENTEERPISVHLKLSLSTNLGQPATQYLSRQRRLTVIIVSFSAFFAIVSFSARALLRAMKNP